MSNTRRHTREDIYADSISGDIVYVSWRLTLGRKSCSPVAGCRALWKVPAQLARESLEGSKYLGYGHRKPGEPDHR